MPTIRTKIPKEANTKDVIKDLDTTDELQEAATVCISAEVGKLAQSTCKAAYIQSLGISLKKSF